MTIRLQERFLTRYSFILDVKSRKHKHIKEYGDFQTPLTLAESILTKLKSEGISPSVIIEPTCGTGSFILSALKTFPNTQIYGLDINPSYLNELNTKVIGLKQQELVNLSNTDFFLKDWNKFISQLQTPILIVGNLPWITSSTQGLINGTNLPKKSNIHGFTGLDSLTGKSNFDISEWMILTLLKVMNESSGTLAFLCKVSVARKIFKFIYKHKSPVTRCTIHMINALSHFNASVDACLLTLDIQAGSSTQTMTVYPSLEATSSSSSLGIIEDLIVNNLEAFRETESLHGKFVIPWRSGIKHDASQIMILTKEGDSYINGQNNKVEIEDTFLYPLLKSTDLAHNNVNETHRWLIVPQKTVGEDTTTIKTTAPKTWEYLDANRIMMGHRGSSIYKGKPPFSVFGVGPYSFTNWKIGISGLHKKLGFTVIGPIQNKPVVLDDTSYLLPTSTKEEALFFYSLLNHPVALKFLNSIIYWKAKRPISVKVLSQLNISKITERANLDYIYKTISDLNTEYKQELIRKYYHHYWVE